ncbi:Threonine--tRNA ligase, partial [Bienertia sinuspersici]
VIKLIRGPHSPSTLVSRSLNLQHKSLGASRLLEKVVRICYFDENSLKEGLKTSLRAKIKIKINKPYSGMLL